MAKKSLDDWLNEVNYSYLNGDKYVPSEFALTFMNFIKLVNGEQGESNKTPPVHLAMMDKLASPERYIANLCHRGLGKTTVFAEYLVLYVAVFGSIPYLPNIDGIIYVAATMEGGAKDLRKNIEFRYEQSDFLKSWLPKVHFTDAYMEFKNKENKVLGVKSYGAQTGIRGSKIYGKRPQLAILDDLLSDDDAKSEVVMNAIKDTIYKGVFHALDPVKKKIIFNGTPFHSQDILVEAVESGGWNVNVWPVCEVWPVDDKDDFRGSWEDRFTYEAVKDAYDLSVSTGKESAFNQELMLRLSSADDRMIQDEEIRWYKKADLLSRKNTYNFYVTSDFATTNKTSSDDTVIAVWAYNANGDWFLVDGICGKQLMDKTFDDLFRLVQMYRPQSVGIETSGQQGGFVTLLQKEQMTRNIWFNFASNRTGNLPGINSAKDKLTRLNQVVPWFKTGKIYFPEEDRKSKWIGQYLSEIRLVTKTAIKGKDNCLDTISMLAQITAWKPSEETPLKQNDDGVWESDEVEVEDSYLTNYIV